MRKFKTRQLLLGKLVNFKQSVQTRFFRKFCKPVCGNNARVNGGQQCLNINPIENLFGDKHSKVSINKAVPRQGDTHMQCHNGYNYQEFKCST